MKTPIIEFNDYTFRYDAQSEPTLYNINLTIYKGEKIIIAGPSGCGKSTLISCINGLIPFSFRGQAYGEVKIEGKSTLDMSIAELSKRVGTVLQDSDNQFIGLTVGEDIAFALENDCIPLPEMTERVKGAAQSVGVGDHLSHAPHELSGGQKQRVSLAGVMVDEVPILLFDEPLANLDPATGKSAIELIEQIRKERGVTVLIVEHRLEDALQRGADRIVLMKEGRIIADCSPNELLSSDLLLKTGIREPLYLSALKYAGVSVTPEKKPGNIGEMVIDPEDSQRVRSWVKSIQKSAPKEKKTPIVSLKNVSFAYQNGKEALSGITSEICEGEMLSLVGKNGAGKSTLAKLICGFEKPARGEILLKGEDTAKLSIKQRAEHIGYVMQNPNQMISKTTVKEEVAWGLRLRGYSQEETEDKLNEILKVCGLYPYRNWPIGSLSYGQKKRVTVSSILVLSPEMIILDEPTAGQDFGHYTEIMEFLKNVNSMGVTIMMVSHDMHLMLEYCERALVLSDGKLIADDKPEKILTNSDIIEKAALKETSLYELALKCSLEEPGGFVGSFIEYERSFKGHE